jgi:hypothetical protein
MELISRKEAKAQGLTRYYTGKPCLRGHVGDRIVSSESCYACQTERQQTSGHKTYIKAYHNANSETIVPYRAAYYAANREKLATQQAVYRKSNPEKIAARNAAYNNTNREKIAAQQAVYIKANPAVIAAIKAQRRAAKLKATPAWADRQTIKKIYDDCAFISRVTGEKHHVDHRYPLQSDWVCGLHVIENLQILTATENLTKGNKLLEQFA